ncbi:MAG: peptidylprolyl isomerase [Pseudomonadota bacterium]
MLRRVFLTLCASLFAASAFAQDAENILVIEVEGKANGIVEIELLPDLAPNHVERIKTLAREGAYDGVAFHRVIDGFMAQTGDVQNAKRDAAPSGPPGTGGSSYPDLAAEFTQTPFDRGVLGMARAQNPNSANSQFFIMFADGYFLNGQYTVFGRVTSGMEVVDQIQRGQGQSGAVPNPDFMKTVRVKADG